MNAIKIVFHRVIPSFVNLFALLTVSTLLMLLTDPGSKSSVHTRNRRIYVKIDQIRQFNE